MYLAVERLERRQTQRHLFLRMMYVVYNARVVVRDRMPTALHTSKKLPHSVLAIIGRCAVISPTARMHRIRLYW